MTGVNRDKDQQRDKDKEGESKPVAWSQCTEKNPARIWPEADQVWWGTLAILTLGRWGRKIESSSSAWTT
jgi:hypothetical protein